MQKLQAPPPPLKKIFHLFPSNPSGKIEILPSFYFIAFIGVTMITDTFSHNTDTLQSIGFS